MHTISPLVSMQSDGTMGRITPDGTEETVPVPPLAPVSDEAITAAAVRDPDALPLTDADLTHLKRVPRTKTLRRALGLTQEACGVICPTPLMRRTA